MVWQARYPKMEAHKSAGYFNSNNENEPYTWDKIFSIQHVNYLTIKLKS